MDEQLPELDDSAIYQVIRFNEGIDQALSESAARFMEKIEESRDFAIAVLAHDLRSPLNAIYHQHSFFKSQSLSIDLRSMRWPLT